MYFYQYCKGLLFYIHIMKYLFLVISVLHLISYNRLKEREQLSNPISELSKDTCKIGNSVIDFVFIRCDSIYDHKGYEVTLTQYCVPEDGSDNSRNSIFVFRKKINNCYSELYRDTIYSRVLEVEFEDYNKDGIKDILIQNISDARSNWTYYLYLVDIEKDVLKKIQGFEQIKNPRYNSLHDIIENYVLSGENWISFYKIQGDSIYDYGITLYDIPDEEGEDNLEKEYGKALQQIMNTD